jgi:hypothetical protein
MLLAANRYLMSPISCLCHSNGNVDNRQLSELTICSVSNYCPDTREVMLGGTRCSYVA